MLSGLWSKISAGLALLAAFFYAKSAYHKRKQEIAESEVETFEKKDEIREEMEAFEEVIEKERLDEYEKINRSTHAELDKRL